MPNTHPFIELRDEARRDPRRARRIDAAKRRWLEEVGLSTTADTDDAAGSVRMGLDRYRTS